MATSLNSDDVKCAGLSNESDKRECLKEIVLRPIHDSSEVKFETKNWTPEHTLQLSTEVLLFGAAVIIATVSILWRMKAGPDAILKVLGLVLIIFGAIFLTVAGYSDRQIAPVIGLLGTIAGYLLGGKDSSSCEEKSQATKIDKREE